MSKYRLGDFDDTQSQLGDNVSEYMCEIVKGNGMNTLILR